MSIYVFTPTDLAKRKTKKLEYMIYTNFKHLSQYPNLLHTNNEIIKLLTSKNIQFYLYIKKAKIAAYLVGDIIDLGSGSRKVLFINYIFVAKAFRSAGIGNILLNYAQKVARDKNIDGIMLVCDTENTPVHDWYLRHGFMLDLELRRYEKYDVLYKNII